MRQFKNKYPSKIYEIYEIFIGVAILSLVTEFLYCKIY